MKPEQQRITIANAVGLFRIEPLKRVTRKGKDDPKGVVLWYCEEHHGGAASYDEVPFYPRSFQALRQAGIKLGLHDTDNLELRVKWINALRMVVSRRCPKNNSGTPIVSDIDLLNASEEERCEALVRAIGKWPKKIPLSTMNKVPDQESRLAPPPVGV